MNYETVKAYWDEVFASEETRVPLEKSIGIETLDLALDWLCEGAEGVLDFGCGNGVTLCLCALRGTKRHVGIDLSPAGISAAERLFAEAPGAGAGGFFEGGVERLTNMPANDMDAAILFNIADNLPPVDAAYLLEQIARIVKPGGKALLKLNPYLTAVQIAAWDIKTLEGDLLDDGLYLWNKDTAFWRGLLAPRYAIEKEADVYYAAHDQHNRLFLLTVK
ncbi:MAG: class I SAM-dependent methyltransferase [Clostridiaceae bacterium]